MHAPPPAKLRSRLMLVALLLALPAFAYIVFDALERRTQAISDAKRDALGVAALLQARNQEIVRLSSQLLVGVGSLQEVSNTRSPAPCNRQVSEIHRLHPRLSNIGTFLPNGDIFCSAMKLERPLNIHDRPHFSGAMDTRSLIVGDIVLSRRDGESVLPMIQPVLSESGDVRLLAFVTLNVAWLEEGLSHSALPEGSTLTLLDGEGEVLARFPGKGHLGRRVAYADTVRAYTTGAWTDNSWRAMEDGIEQLFVIAPFHKGLTSSAYLSIGVPLASVVGSANAVFVRSLAIETALLLALCTGLWLASLRLVLNPLEALRRAIERMKAGERGARTGISSVASREFVELAQTLDAMASEIEQRDDSLRRVNRTLRVLSSSNRTLLRTSREDDLLHEMCRIAVGIGGYLQAWVGFLETEPEQRIRPVAMEGKDPSFINDMPLRWSGPGAFGLAAAAVESGHPCVARDVPGDALFAPLRDVAAKQGFRSLIALPLHEDARVMGVLVLHARESDAFADDELEVLMELAGDLAHGISTLRLAIKHRAAEETIRQLAYSDTLTGLPNRIRLFEALESSLEERRERHETAALVVLNIDRFREFQDSLGLQNADRILREAAMRLKHAVEGHFLAKLDSDEFAVLLPGATAEEAFVIAGRMCQAIDRPLDVAGLTVDIQASAGIAIFPGHARDASGLYQQAERAVIQAKIERKPFALASSDLDTSAPRRLAMIRELRDAIQNDQFTLHYQPEIDSASGEICAVEALVRWNHPVRGLVPPGEFISLAEHTGLIKSLTYWVMEAAVKQCFEWREQGIDLPIAVNLSEYNLRDAELLPRLERLLSTWGVSARQLRFEVTESTLMEDIDRSMNVLNRLRDMGVKVYIDDFGSGYSSLTSLARLPLDFLKIDRGFVSKINHSGEYLAIVSAIIRMAHALRLEVVAEGVETEEQAATLQRLRCDHLQGFYFSAPLVPDQYPALLEKQKRLQASSP